MQSTTIILKSRNNKDKIVPLQQKPTAVYWLENKLYLNITNKCSNNCFFCIKNFKNGIMGFNLKLIQDPTAIQIIAQLEEVMHMRKWAEIVFCGFGEPTKRLDCLLEVTRWIRRHFGKSLQIRVNTNGHGILLNPNRDVIKELKTEGVDKLSISLNAENEKTYTEVCRPNIENAYNATLEFISKAKKEIAVEITAVTTPEVDLCKIAKTAEELNVKFRVRQHISCYW